MNEAFFTREGDTGVTRPTEARGVVEADRGRARGAAEGSEAVVGVSRGVESASAGRLTLRARRGRLERGVKAPRPRSSENVKEEPEEERRCLRSWLRPDVMFGGGEGEGTVAEAVIIIVTGRAMKRGEV